MVIFYKANSFDSFFFNFRTKLVDGTEVVQEVQAKPKTSYSSPGQGPGLFGNFDEVNGNKPGLEGMYIIYFWSTFQRILNFKSHVSS